MKRFDLVPPELDERLWEWGHFFRDRKHLEHCRSIEHRFRAASEDFGPDGWGDMDAAPRSQPAKSYRLLRAIETHEAIQTQERPYKWAITYAYCYPSLPKFVVLRSMKKYTGRRLAWAAFLDLLDIGRVRVYTTIGLTQENFSSINAI